MQKKRTEDGGKPKKIIDGNGYCKYYDMDYSTHVYTVLNETNKKRSHSTGDKFNYGLVNNKTGDSTKDSVIKYFEVNLK